MIVSVPKEIMQDEGRVAAIPATVRKMVDAGLTVLVEAGAGAGTHFADAAYREAGAEIVADAAQLWQRADVVLKVKEPLKHPEFGCFEDELLGEGLPELTDEETRVLSNIGGTEYVGISTREEAVKAFAAKQAASKE